MKTPRDILLARHQAAAPKLDAIRQSTVAAVCDRRSSTDNALERQSQTAATIWQILWLEMVWPCRRIWTGLAVVWVGILIINFSQRDGSQTVIAKSSPPAEMMMTFRDQQKLLNELFADRSLPVDADRPRIYSPKPRTENFELLTA
ncbi:MAG: hypothetical protein WDN00_10070 [Limisphaerales bacterium]